ncbi:hypothetical protein [Krasilnikovia sp. M28-CT-15]
METTMSYEPNCAIALTGLAWEQLTLPVVAMKRHLRGSHLEGWSG